MDSSIFENIKFSDDCLITKDLLQMYGYKWRPFDGEPDNDYGEAYLEKNNQMIRIYIFSNRIEVESIGKHISVKATFDTPCKYHYLDLLFGFMSNDAIYPDKFEYKTEEE